MLHAIVMCLAGLAVLVLGAEFVTRGGGALAARLGVPPIVIGLTIVAIGTSAPELAVGIDAAMQGNGPLAVGNIAGTNTVNLLLILGLSALIRPIVIQMHTLWLDLPAMIIAALAMLALSLDGVLSRFDGAVLIAAGALYTALVIWLALRESRSIRAEYAREFDAPRDAPSGNGKLAIQFVILMAGIGLIVLAADWFVDGAVALARLWRVSDAFIGLTVVAIGTSSPELVTTIVSTLKGERDIAIGNLLGSSIYNIVFILGVTCVVPLGGLPVTPELSVIDIPIMVAVAAVCAPVFMLGKDISRAEGAFFVGAYIIYLSYLLIART